MAHIFLDESGDLGFRPTYSKWFLFTIVLTSSYKKCLQAVDFVSWAIFRKYERGDYEYYEDIKNHIVEEKLLFS